MAVIHSASGTRTEKTMRIAKVFNTDDAQTVKLPKEFRFDSDAVSIRRDGDAVILEPIKGDNWPAGFFESIRIDDSAFDRPEQGTVPLAPSLD